MLKKFLRWLLPYIAYFIYQIFLFTWRVQYEMHPEMKKMLKNKQPFLLAHWHGDEYALLQTLKMIPIATIISTSQDGEMMNKLVQLVGGTASRGSSTRGGATGLKGLIRLVRQGNNASVAVDGPKGPIYQVKPGVFELSRIMKLPIFAAGVACSHCYRSERAWNKGYLPKLFSRVSIVWLGPYSAVDKDQDPRDPKLAKDLTLLLDSAHQQAVKLIASSKPK